MLYYDKEIPYSVEVKVEQFNEENKLIHINAVIYVERDSQRYYHRSSGCSLEEGEYGSTQKLSNVFLEKLFI